MFGLQGKVSASILFVCTAVALNVVLGNSIPHESSSKLITRQTNPPPNLAAATWITTTNDSGLAAASSAYRFFVQAPIILPTLDISVAISADNAYSLYFNGKLVGSGLDWTTPQQWDIPNVDGEGPLLFAILTTNFEVATPFNNPTAVIADFQFSNAALGQGFKASTGFGWKGITPVPIGFEQIDTDDSAWPAAFIVGPDGVAPWGVLPPAIDSTLC